jgi:hypothetical protein
MHLAPTNRAVFTEAFTEHIMAIATLLVGRQGWSPQQVQLAEDYIQTLSKGYPLLVDRVPRPIGLKSENARKIRALLKEQKRPLKWNDNKWQQFGSPDRILRKSCNTLGVSQERFEAAQDYLLDLQKDPAAPVPELLKERDYAPLVKKVKELARSIESYRRTARRTS